MNSKYEIAKSQESGTLAQRADPATAERRRRSPSQRKPHKGYYLIPLLFVAALVAPRHTRSQTAATPAAAQPAAPALPQRVVYRQVFQHLAFLDYQANIADQHGQDGNALRNYYQNQAHLTPTEAALLKSTAHDAVTATQAINQQIHAEVTIFRAQFAGGKWPKGKPLPPPPPQMKTLQAAKDKIILDHLSTIQTGFGTARFQHLDNFVQAAIAPHISLATAPTPGSSTADKGTTPPLLPPAPWLQ